MTLPRYILTDVDGTILDWITSFEEFMDKKGFVKVPETDSEYRLGKRYNITYDQSRDIVREFNESDYILNLKPLNDAVDIISKLHDEHGFKFIAITAMGNDPVSYNKRCINLKNVFGDVFEEVICIGVGQDKSDTLARWADSHFFWVEDHVGNGMAGHKLGLRSILMTDTTNAHRLDNPLIRVHNWSQIYDIVCDAYALPK